MMKPMIEYRFIFESYKSPSSRVTCPSCGHKNVFTLYIDTLTGERLPEKYGRCNRADSCGYFQNPYADGFAAKVEMSKTTCRSVASVNTLPNPTKILPNSCTDFGKTATLPTPPTPFYIDQLVFRKSLLHFSENHFTQYLTKLFGKDISENLSRKYHVGTSKHWPGATVFWQVDLMGNIRSGKIILYGSDGKRIKQPFNHNTWVHAVLHLENFNLHQCLFGEHLLAGNTKPVAIVESEKTAIIASIYLPQFIWLAAGGKEGLNQVKCQVLKDRQVTLWPDVNAFAKWKKKANEFGFGISDLIEKNATEDQRAKGWDLADYLIRCDSTGLAMTDYDYPVMWDVEL
jgi:hypothetical protein